MKKSSCRVENNSQNPTWAPKRAFKKTVLILYEYITGNFLFVGTNVKFLEIPLFVIQSKSRDRCLVYQRALEMAVQLCFDAL